MKTLGLHTTIILLAICASACTPKFISKNELGNARKGMQMADVQATMSKPPIKVFAFEHSRKQYDGLQYSVQTGQTTQYVYMPGVNGAPGYTMPQTVPVVSNAYFLFEKPRGLLFWGLFEDFTKSRDRRISAPAEAMKNAANEAERL